MLEPYPLFLLQPNGIALFSKLPRTGLVPTAMLGSHSKLYPRKSDLLFQALCASIPAGKLPPDSIRFDKVAVGTIIADRPRLPQRVTRRGLCVNLEAAVSCGCRYLLSDELNASSIHILRLNLRLVDDCEALRTPASRSTARPWRMAHCASEAVSQSRTARNRHCRGILPAVRHRRARPPAGHQCAICHKPRVMAAVRSRT